ncbi:hypothetical protein ACHAO4_003091 [Trichoderma viride]
MKVLHMFILIAFMLMALVSGQLSKEDRRVIAREPTRYLIELSPGIQRWVTEEEKWKLWLSGQKFMDITDAHDTNSTVVQIQSPWDGDFPVTYPSKCLMQKKARPLAGKLSKGAMRANLHKLNEFYNRYYMSEFGRQSSRWVLERVQDTVKEAGADSTVTVEGFTHPWPQISTIARIQGLTNDTIIIGAHQDSITPYELTRHNVSALGPEDGSGAVTIMEVFSTLLKDKGVVGGLAQNTVEFHWYSAESAGLLGSQEIFRSYVKTGRKVKAMMQQDMVGYVQGVLNASKPETLGVVTDYTYFGLNTFIRTVIDEVTLFLNQLAIPASFHF